jgi:hypothetical protein
MTLPHQEKSPFYLDLKVCVSTHASEASFQVKMENKLLLLTSSKSDMKRRMS